MEKIKLIIFILVIPVLIFSANSKIDSLHHKLTGIAESTERIDLLVELSLEYIKVDTIKSIDFSNQAMKLSDKIGEHKAQTIANSGYINFLIGNYETSLNLSLKALSQQDIDNDLTVKADVLKNTGYVYTELKKYNLSLEYFNYALDIHLELDHKNKISIIYSLIANTYIMLNKHELALEYYHKSLLLAKERNNKAGMANLYYNIGEMYNSLSEYGKALESFFNCLKIYEKLADPAGIGDANNVIGNIFQTIGNFDNALEYYNRNLIIQEELGNKYGISVAYNNIGIIYNDKINYEKALEYYFKALEIDEELNDENGIATVTNNIGIIYYELKEYDRALKYFQQSLSLSKKMNDIWAIANTSNNIAELYFDLAQYKKSLYYVNKGFEYAEEIQAKDLKLESFEILSKLNSKTNNYQKAFEYFKKYSELKDTLFSTSIREVANFQMIYETEKKEKENALLRKDNQIKDLQIEKQKNLRFSLFIIILLVIFFFLLVFKLYRDKKKEHLLMIEKNKLITKQKKQLDNAFKELKKLNLNLEKNVKEIKISRERLKILNKIIRHDLANDFSVIKSAINIYRSRADNSMIDEIQKRVSKSLDTIKKYRRYEAFIETDPNLKAMSVSKMLTVFALDFPNIQINVSGECVVLADEAINSVFKNLASNSIDHGKSTEIDIKISSNSEFCEIRFMDNGSGIPENIKKKIFDEGFHYGKSGHTGIGLHIVKQTVEACGGSVSVEDNKPNGAVFIICLRKAL